MYVFIAHCFGCCSSLMCFGCCMSFKCVVVASVTLVVCNYSSFMHFGCCSSFKLYNCCSLLKSVCYCSYFFVWLPLAYHFNWLLLKCFGCCSSLKKLFIIQVHSLLLFSNLITYYFKALWLLLVIIFMF